MADARTIFLSSTFLEFEAARAELELALWRAGFRVFYLGGAASETTVANCCDHVSRADIVIVLLGASYGSTPDGRDVHALVPRRAVLVGV